MKLGQTYLFLHKKVWAIVKYEKQIGKDSNGGIYAFEICSRSKKLENWVHPECFDGERMYLNEVSAQRLTEVEDIDGSS